MMARRWQRSALAVLAVFAVLAACTADEPPPPPMPAPAPAPETTGAVGVRAGFVLPPAAGEGDPQAAQLQSSLRRMQSNLPDGVIGLRPVAADGPEFVGDLARLLVDRGNDLVCLVGPDVMRVANRLASRHPELRFCAVPAGSSEPPDNVRAIDLRVEELGHIAGAVAADEAGSGPVALILAPDRIGHQRFRDGVRTGVGDSELLEWFPSSAESAGDAVAAAIDAEAEVLILDVGWQPAELLLTVRDAGLRLVAPLTALSGSRFGDQSLLAWSVRWDAVLGPVVRRLADRETEVGSSFGLAEDVFVLTPGPRSSPTRIDELTEAIVAGTRPAIAPPEPRGTDPDEAPDEGQDEDG